LQGGYRRFETIRAHQPQDRDKAQASGVNPDAWALILLGGLSVSCGPNIQAMRDVVVTKADLLIEEEVPSALLQLCAHVAGYEITAAQWAEGSYEEHLSLIPFPGRELREYTRDRFTHLKTEQATLLGRRRGRSDRRR
jgi:hypothetical protein